MYAIATVTLLCFCLPRAHASLFGSHGYSSSTTSTLSVIGQILEGLGVQLLMTRKTVKSLTGRLLSDFWGLLLLTIGFLAVLESLDGDYEDIDTAVVVPIVGSLFILASIGAILRTLARYIFIRKANIKDNWQCEWLRRCVLLTNPNLTRETSLDIDHYSALYHLFDDMREVCKPSINRGVILSAILFPFFFLVGILQIIVWLLENLIYFFGSLAFRRKAQWKIDNHKFPIVTDLQLGTFEEKEEEWETREHGNWFRWAMTLWDREKREQHRESWAELISSLHVANILGTTTYSALLSRSVVMETPSSLFGRIKAIKLQVVAGASYGRKADFLTVLRDNIRAVQGKEPGLQLVWNAIICNQELQAPRYWAKHVLDSVVVASENRLKTTTEDVITHRELNHVATGHENWFIDVAMYGWWNMTRCEDTDQMVDELATAKFTNTASVIVSAAETILNEEPALSDCLVGSIGQNAYNWFSDTDQRVTCKEDENQPTLPPSASHYGMRNFVDGLEKALEGISEIRKPSYAVVAAGLWTKAVGGQLEGEQCTQIARAFDNTKTLLDLVKGFAKAYWQQNSDANPVEHRQRMPHTSVVPEVQIV